MTTNDIQIGFDSYEELLNYLNKNQDMDYKSINASELLLLLQANQNKYILLYKLKIVGHLKFDKLEFLESFLFRDCQITGDVNMQNAIFNGTVSLQDLSYQGFIFSDTTCENEVVVKGKMSGDVLSFGNHGQPSTAKFKGGVRITDCDLDNVFFGSHNHLYVPQFNNSTLKNSIFIERSNIKTCLFQYVETSNIQIGKCEINELGFVGSTFEKLELYGSKFGKSATFSKGGVREKYFLGFTTIKGPFNMHNCSFLSDIKFDTAVFNEVINFTGIFSTNLNLNNSKFEKGLNLGTSQFLGGLNLGTSQFGALLDFNECVIYKSLNWKNACYASEGKEGIVYNDINFADNTIDRPKAPYPVCK
jgi:hypothetical protein